MRGLGRGQLSACTTRRPGWTVEPRPHPKSLPCFVHDSGNFGYLLMLRETCCIYVTRLLMDLGRRNFQVQRS